MKVPNPMGSPAGGLYDDVAERLAGELGAQAIVLMVIEGHKGTGLSVTARAVARLSWVPRYFETAARSIRELQRRGLHP